MSMSYKGSQLYRNHFAVFEEAIFEGTSVIVSEVWNECSPAERSFDLWKVLVQFKRTVLNAILNGLCVVQCLAAIGCCIGQARREDMPSVFVPKINAQIFVGVDPYCCHWCRLYQIFHESTA